MKNVNRPCNLHRVALIFSAVVVSGLSGCGGVDDPFPRAEVSGAVTFDGMPLAWGQIFFKGEVDSKTSEAAQATSTIRDGTFASAGRIHPGVGPNKILVTVFKGVAPTQEEIDNDAVTPEVVGYYETEQTLEDGGELKIEITQSELKATRPEL